MWQQNYTPVGDSIGLSTLVATIPILTLLLLLGVLRKPAWLAALTGLSATILVAAFVYRMPPLLIATSVTYGAAFGLFPIGWVVFSAILLYRVTIESGNFDVLKDSIGHLTNDPRLQVLLIAFAFGAFIEGAAGFGTPVAVAAAMLTGLGFSPFYAAALCLLANTAPVAFGSIGIPITTLAITTNLPLDRLSAAVGRICAPISLVVPAYIIVVMSGWKGLRAVFPAAAVSGIVFAGTQFVISNYVGPQLTDILASLAAILALVLLTRVWRPRDKFVFAENHVETQLTVHPSGRVMSAWIPYMLLVAVILLWGYKPLAAYLNEATIVFAWPDLHNLVQRTPPVAEKAAPYGAIYTFNWLSASGTACLIAAIVGAAVSGLSLKQFVRVFAMTIKQLVLAELTYAAVLGLAFLMNYCGVTGTLGLAFTATGAAFPVFSALLGWLGVFLTGSDTSANALFGTLQVVTAIKLGLSPVLIAASNSAGGVMGKMISLASIAVGAAATSMKPADESRLFRFTLKHSAILAVAIGVITLFYARFAPQLVP